MISNILAYITAGAMTVSSLTGCSTKQNDANTAIASSGVTAYAQFTAEYSNRDLDSSYDASTSTKITLSGNSASINGDGAAADGASIKITKDGTYIVSGQLTGGSITIDASDSDKIQLVLDNTDITSANTSAINEINCDKLFITLVGDNKISDSENYTFADGEDEPNGAIFAKHDMTINGSGALTVNGVYKHGIVSKDDLKITGGTINVTSADDGIRGRDSVLIKDGTISVTSGGDGIKSNNDSGEEKGRISIDGGVVNIIAEQDGIQAESVLQINGGTLTVNAGDINAEVKSEGMGGDRGNRGDMQNPPDGNMPDTAAPSDADKANRPDRNDANRFEQNARPDNMPQPPEGGMTPPDTANFDGERADMPPMGGGRGGMQNPPDGNMPQDMTPPNESSNANTTDEQTSDSKKALKSANALYINGGTLTLSAEDDTIHANVAVTINDGTLSLSTADDGIHADYTSTINGGTIDITKCYEGIEGKAVVINGGNITIKAADDAVNAANPEIKNAQPGRGNDEVYIEINGGTLYAVSGYDSLDSNGNIFINDGMITLDGPTNGMDCAIDYDGKAYINGGTLNASGVSSSTFDSTSKQASLAVVFSSSLQAGTTVTLSDSNGNQLAEITPTQRFGGVLFSSDKIKQGEAYTVKAGDVTVSAQQASLITAVNQDGSAVSGGNHGGGMMPGGGAPNHSADNPSGDRANRPNAPGRGNNGGKK